LPNEPEDIVVNTGPLIALGRIGAFEVIARLPLRFVAPRQVAEEIEAGARAGHPVVVPPWVTVDVLKGTVVPLAEYVLDQGEAAVIELAVERGIADVCIDEWRGRRAEASVGLRVTGSLGLLGRAKRIGLIPKVLPWVEKLSASGVHYHPNLLRDFLAAMGE
jgi:predicted nucleic acid-binding protein